MFLKLLLRDDGRVSPERTVGFQFEFQLTTRVSHRNGSTTSGIGGGCGKSDQSDGFYAADSTKALLKGIDSKFVWLQAPATT